MSICATEMQHYWDAVVIRNFLQEARHTTRCHPATCWSSYVGITGTYQHVLRLTAQLWKARCGATDGRVACKLIVDGNEIPFENRRFLPHQSVRALVRSDGRMFSHRATRVIIGLSREKLKMKDLTRTAIFVFPLTLASQNASATAAGGSRRFGARGTCRSAFAGRIPGSMFLRCSLITNHPNGRRVSVHWFAGVLQSLCSLS
jgi:hypothetical protein